MAGLNARSLIRLATAAGLCLLIFLYMSWSRLSVPPSPETLQCLQELSVFESGLPCNLSLSDAYILNSVHEDVTRLDSYCAPECAEAVRVHSTLPSCTTSLLSRKGPVRDQWVLMERAAARQERICTTAAGGGGRWNATDHTLCAVTFAKLQRQEWILSGRPKTPDFTHNTTALLRDLTGPVAKGAHFTTDAQLSTLNRSERIDLDAYLTSLTHSPCGPCMWKWLVGDRDSGDAERFMQEAADAPNQQNGDWYVEYVERTQALCVARGAGSWVKTSQAEAAVQNLRRARETLEGMKAAQERIDAWRVGHRGKPD